MLIGCADPQAAGVGAPTLAQLDTEPVTLAGCSVLQPRIKPVYPVSGAFCIADITLPKLRFACLPDQLAFAGTETL